MVKAKPGGLHLSARPLSRGKWVKLEVHAGSLATQGTSWMSPLTSLVSYQDLSGATVTPQKDTHLLERPGKRGQTSPRSQQRSACHLRVLRSLWELGLQRKSCVGHRDLLGL